MKFREWFPRAWGNGSRWLLVAAMFFAATFGTLLAVAAWSLLAPGPYDPLGAYPTQQVNEAEVNGIPTVVATPGATISVTGTKCNDSDQSVKVRGHYEFRSDDGQRGTPRYWTTVSFRLVPDALAG